MTDNDEDLGFDEDEALGAHDVVELERVDGSRLACVVLAIVEHEGREYALLAPEVEDEEDDDAGVLVVSWEETAAGSPRLGPVEDDGVVQALQVVLKDLLDTGER